MPAKEVAVVIPTYKFQPSAPEIFSLKTCLKFLSSYDMALVAPGDLDLKHYFEIDSRFEVQRFDRRYFEGIEGYNRLLLSEEFYERFDNYKYILIYQLDALVFKDELSIWAGRDYDYVGAPWIRRRLSIFLNLLMKASVLRALQFLIRGSAYAPVGNGGLSLRKVSVFLEVCRKKKNLSTKWKTNEDYYWSFFANSDGRLFRKPDWREALRFSIETEPKLAEKYLNGSLPFGVHAWEKNDPHFWTGKISAVGYPSKPKEATDTPTVSIITVTYNCRDDLGKTIESIRRQSVRNIEFVVVDGASTDGTVELIKENGQIIDKWVSEEDTGIYDAMNKGLRLATGSYIWFINAGDELYERDTIEKIFRSGALGDVYYGHTMIVDSEGKELGLRRLRPPERLSWRSFQKGQLVSHQSFIAKRELAPPFNLKYQYSADTDWQINILKKANVIINTRQVLSRFLAGGRSRKTILPSLYERFDIMVKNYGIVKTALNHIIIGIKFFAFLIRHRRF